MPFERSMETEFPAPLNPRQVLMKVHSRQKRNRGGMRYFPIQQRRQTMLAGNPVKEIVRRDILLDRSTGVPFRELLLRAVPDHLLLPVFDRAEPILEKSVGVGAAQQCPATRPFPLSMLLFEV